MKRLWTITILVSLLIIAGGVAIVLWPRTLPPEQCSAVYRRYCDRDDLKVAFVKDYRIGDSITVDVTTITAKDSAGWEALLRDMYVNETTIEFTRMALKGGNAPVTEYRCEIGHPENHINDDRSDLWLVVMMHIEKTAYIFEVTTETQATIIQSRKVKEAYNHHN
ncbi:MAG: hypothetical protein J6031_02395 [Bacteroidales bacterium]|nr:hypothetical protein [Bacteroidales bacterium]